MISRDPARSLAVQKNPGRSLDREKKIRFRKTWKKTWQRIRQRAQERKEPRQET